MRQQQQPQLLRNATQHQKHHIELERSLKEENQNFLNEDPAQVENFKAFLGDELAKMSVEEREKNYEEIHGVNDIVDETPELVAEKLAEFQMELDKIEHKAAYNQAEMISMEYVQDKKLRMAFLRSDSFHCEKAAARFVYYFEEKLRYFGPSALCRSVLLSDLDADDILCLKSGSIQQMPFRDRSGRAILTVHFSNYKRPENYLRAYSYLCLAMAEDDETQRRGYISISYTFGDMAHVLNSQVLSSQVPHIHDWVPLRLQANHAGLNDPILNRIIPIAKMRLTYELRKKMRLCYGEITEYHYNLMTFGIPTESLPFTLDGDLKNRDHERWFGRRVAKEAMEQSISPYDGLSHSTVMVDLPGMNDVLLGKGKPIQNHSGNIRLRGFVDFHLEEYRAAPVRKKFHVAHALMEELRNHAQYPTRFLKRQTVDSWWVPASDEEAVQKIIKTFRTATGAKGGGKTTKSKAKNTSNNNKTKSISNINSKATTKTTTEDDFEPIKLNLMDVQVMPQFRGKRLRLCEGCFCGDQDE